MIKHRIYTTSFSSVYPHYVTKAEKTDFETFSEDAPQMNPSRELITGVSCGVRVEEIEEPSMRQIRCT
ncbi:MAG: DUF2200 family protein [Solirubrobacterales bacterium]|nr:DUF2200 family protein [Solirubrobacterales bacterium]